MGGMQVNGEGHLLQGSLAKKLEQKGLKCHADRA